MLDESFGFFHHSLLIRVVFQVRLLGLCFRFVCSSNISFGTYDSSFFLLSFVLLSIFSKVINDLCHVPLVKGHLLIFTY